MVSAAGSQEGMREAARQQRRGEEGGKRMQARGLRSGHPTAESVLRRRARVEAAKKGGGDRTAMSVG